jgi:hypothetical protein
MVAFDEQTENDLMDLINSLSEALSNLKDLPVFWCCEFADRLDNIEGVWDRFGTIAYEIQRVLRRTEAEEMARKMLHDGYKFREITIDGQSFRATKDGKLEEAEIEIVF